MDGPHFRCDYLGFTAISKPPTGTNALQPHLKELYLKYRRQGNGGSAASLKLVQHGIFITLLRDGHISDELFFSFDAVNFIEAVKFAVVKSSSDKKPKAIFIPLDDTRGPISDKHCFAIDKPFHFLTSTSHPPLVACVVRRPRGVKALDCHLFALESLENALHISSLVGSAQTPPGFESRAGPGFESRSGAINPWENVIERHGFRGDVVRPDNTEYAIYRGQPQYEKAQNMGVYSNEALIGGRLPPTNIQRLSPRGNYYHSQQNEEALVYGLYEQPRSGALMAGPMPRGADNRNASVGTEATTDFLRREDINRNANRHSSGIYQDTKWFSSNSSNNELRHQIPAAVNHQQPTVAPSPNTSRPSPNHDNQDFGPVFSASNLENRELEHTTPAQEVLPSENYSGGKPVAKVPPHHRGIKVLPSDFRNVKLKPRIDKKSESFDSQDSSYDNNNDIMQKYKAIKENMPDDMDNGYRIPTNGMAKADIEKHKQNNSESLLRPDYRQKQDSARHPNRFSAPVYADSAPLTNQWTSNTRAHQPSQSAFNMGGADESPSVKDAEIANMFSNMGMNNGNPRRQHADFDMEHSLGYLP